MTGVFGKFDLESAGIVGIFGQFDRSSAGIAGAFRQFYTLERQGTDIFPWCPERQGTDIFSCVLCENLCELCGQVFLPQGSQRAALKNTRLMTLHGGHKMK